MKRFVFDFGGVLFRWRPAELVRRVWPQRAADEAAAAHWVQQVFQAYSGDWGEFDRGAIGPDELIARVCARTGLAPAEMQALVDAVPDELAPKADTVQLLQRLRAGGAALHYLSNMPAPYATHLSRSHGFLSWFASGVYSSDVKLIKPDPRIFALAAAHFGAEPAALVFLDDHPANVVAARAAGWQALHFTDAASAEQDLRVAGWWPDPA